MTRRGDRRARCRAAVLVGCLLLTVVPAGPPAVAAAAPDLETALVADVWPGASGSVTSPVAFGDAVLFGADDGTHGSELWATDGTAAGTHLVEDVVPGAVGSNPTELTVVGGTVFFVVGPALWATDGTAAGTRRVGDTGASDVTLEHLTAVGSTLFLAASDESAAGDLWKSDGTTLTLVQADVDPTDLVAAGGALFFQGRDDHGAELWRSDGTAAGTARVADVKPGAASSNPRDLAVAGSTLYFAADGGRGRELWRRPVADGTAGPVCVSDAGDCGSSPEGLHAVGTQVWFSATDAAHGRELWRSDGTAAGTALVKDIRYGPESSNPNDLADVDGTLFFAAADQWYGGALWRSDGAAIDTEMVADVTDDAFAGRPTDLTPLGHALFFVVDDAVHGNELWRAGPAPLVNLVLPRITFRGTPSVGTVLSGTDGDWSASDPGYRYEWFIGRQPEPSGTAARFTVPAGAVGKRVTLQVTATAKGRTGTARSNGTEIVVLGTQRLVRRPAVTGRKAVGVLLRVAPGATRPASTVRRYQWLRNGRPIRGATRASYRVTRQDVGRRISVRVVHLRNGYNSVTSTSPQTARIPR